MNRTKLFSFAIIILVLGFTIIGCGDDNTIIGTTDVPIFGNYKILNVVGLQVRIDYELGVDRVPVRGFNPQDMRYLEFNSDHLVSIQLASNDGFRSIQNYVFLNSGSQVYFYSFVFNIYKSQDTLMLWTPTDTILALKDSNAPSREEWVTDIVTDKQLETHVSDGYDLTLHNGSFWISSFSRIFKVNATNGSAKDTLLTFSGAGGIDWVNSSLWIGVGGSRPIYMIDTTTGDFLDSSSFIVPYVNSIAFGGTYLYCASGYGASLVKYEPLSGNLIDSMRIDRSVSGMTFFNGYIYMAVEGVINKCTTDPFQVLDAYQVPGIFISGVTHDNSGLWIMYAEWDKIENKSIIILKRFIP